VVDSVDAAKNGFLWDIAGIPSQEVQIWVYILDDLGNFGSASVEQVTIKDSEPKGMQDSAGRSGGG
jgi:hypothetical protein